MIFWYPDTISDGRRSNSSRIAKSSRTSVRERIANKWSRVGLPSSDVEDEFRQGFRASASGSEALFFFFVSDSETDTSAHGFDHESACLDGEESAAILTEYPTRFEPSVSSKKYTCRADKISGDEHCVSTMFRVVWSMYIDPFIEQPSIFYLCLGVRTPAGRSESHNPHTIHD